MPTIPSEMHIEVIIAHIEFAVDAWCKQFFTFDGWCAMGFHDNEQILFDYSVGLSCEVGIACLDFAIDEFCVSDLQGMLIKIVSIFLGVGLHPTCNFVIDDLFGRGGDDEVGE